MIPIKQATDYIVLQLTEDGQYLNVLKLHKLLYYCQAWSLAFGRGPLFNSGFQAWVHGPVSRPVYDRFVAAKGMYSPVTIQDIESNFDPRTLDTEARTLIDAVLESYGHLTGDQLEEMTHQELPWQEARQGVPPSARSETLISNETMRAFYGARIKAA